MSENEENKNLIIYQDSDQNLITVNSNDPNQNLNPNIEIKNTNEIKNLWNTLDKKIKNSNLNDLNLNNIERIQFKLHDKDFNLKIPIKVTKTYSKNQNILSLVILFVPIAFLFFVIPPILIINVTNIINNSILLISIELILVIIAVLCSKQMKKNPKKILTNSETIINNIKSKFQKITLIKKDGIFEKEYLGFNLNDTFEDIKSKINEEWILERKSDFLVNHQGLMEKINIFSIEVKRTDDSNYLLVQFKVKEKRVRTLKKTTNEIILEKNLEPIKFEFLILL